MHAQSNYTNTKLKDWFRRLLRHPVRKRSGPILHPRTQIGAVQVRNVHKTDAILVVRSTASEHQDRIVKTR